jgi:hypothetical protein
MALIKTLKRHALLTYFVLAYVLTWAFWIPMIFTRPSVPFYVVWWVGNIMPSLVGILLTALFSGNSGLGELFRRLGQVRSSHLVCRRAVACPRASVGSFWRPDAAWSNHDSLCMADSLECPKYLHLCGLR